MTIRRRGYRVPPTSVAQIRASALELREFLGISQGVKVIDLIEYVLPEIYQGFYFEVCEECEMWNDHALTFPDRRLIKIRNDVYERAHDLTAETAHRYGRDNFTLAHEIGHLIQHQGVSSFARGDAQQSDHKVFEDSEWQADTFAAEFLMPFNQIPLCQSVEEVQRRYLVSREAARVRIEKVKS